MLAKISISATSPNSRADFYDKFSPTDLNPFPPIGNTTQPHPTP